MKRSIDWHRGVSVVGELRVVWLRDEKREEVYRVSARHVSYRYEHLGPRLRGSAIRDPLENIGLKHWRGDKTFYRRDVLSIEDTATGHTVPDLCNWALDHLSKPAPLVSDPSDTGLTIGLIYRQRVGRNGERDQRYAVQPMEARFSEDGAPLYLGGGSLTEEFADGQLDWDRCFDEPSRFIAFYDRATGELIHDPRAWLRNEADRLGVRIFGINA